MSRNLTARDRTVLIKLAHELPKGSEERRSILAGLSAVASQTSPYLYGKGKDEDWIVYFTEYRLQGDTLYVHGYLKGSLAHMSGASHGPLHHDREWAAFDAVFVKVYRKSSVVFLESVQFTGTSQRGKPLGQETWDSLSIRVRRIVRSNSKVLSDWIKGILPDLQIGLKGKYKGALPVLQIQGPYRERIRGGDLKGVHLPFSSSALLASKPVSDPNKAEQDTKRMVSEYHQSSFPGGSAAVVAIVYWPSIKKWSGVMNSYYSFS